MTKALLRAFRFTAITVAGLIILLVVDSALRDLTPDYKQLSVLVEQNPRLWVVVGVLSAILILYFGNREIGDLIKTHEVIREDQAAQIETLSNDLAEERRRRGTDLLTGLPNHFKFQKVLDQIISDKNERKLFSLIYIDLFDLKKINDTQNEEFGSRYIQEVSKDIHLSMYRRENMYRVETDAPELVEGAKDDVFRSREGGDEFFLLINGDLLGALFLIKRVLKRLKEREGHYRSVANNPERPPLADLRVGFRAGVIELSDFETGQEAISAVKQAYYHARRRDLPDNPSRFVVCQSDAEGLPEKHQETLREIDGIIEGVGA